MMRNDLCWCGSGKKYKKCHEDFDERISEMKFDIFRGQVRPPKKVINNEKDIAGVRAAGVINDGALDLMTELVRPAIRRTSASRSTRSSVTASRRRRRSSRRAIS